MTATFVYMTCSDRDEATRIGRALVEERLAACVNVLDAMTSIYRWEGAVMEGQETVLIAKTTTERLAALTDRVKALHSYSCPCVAALDVVGGNGAFIDWITAETS